MMYFHPFFSPFETPRRGSTQRRSVFDDDDDWFDPFFGRRQQARNRLTQGEAGSDRQSSDRQLAAPEESRSVGPWWSGGGLGSGQLQMSETDDAVVFKSTWEGFDRDELSVDIKGDMLVVSGQRSNKHHDEKTGSRSESFSRVVRSALIPVHVDKEAIRAKFRNDSHTLTIALPKIQNKQTKSRINIDHDDGKDEEAA